MQKINKVLVVLLMFVSSSSFAEQQTSDVREIDNEQGLANAINNQELLLDIMKDNFEFELKRNKLQNELELQKLMNQIDKLKVPTNNYPVSREPVRDSGYNDIPPLVMNNDYSEEKEAITPVDTSTYSKVPPKLVLMSEVGGVKTFGISIENKVKFVKLNSGFTDNAGNKYFIREKNKKFIITEQ